MAGIDYTSKSVPINQKAFNGGLNSTDSPVDLQDNEASDLANVDVSHSIIKRNGYAQLNTSAANSGAICTSLHWFENTSADLLLGTFGNALFKMDSLDGTWDDITSGLTITAGVDNRFKWTTFKDTAYGTNDTDVPIQVDNAASASTWTTITGLSKAKWVETWNNYMFLANVVISSTDHPTRVYWSTINDPDTWATTDFNEIGYQDGTEITGLVAAGDRLVIFKERSIWVAYFTGDADAPFRFEPTPSTVGAVSGYSIQRAANGLIFMAQDGIYFFDGSNSTYLSHRVATTIDGLNKNRFANCVAIYQGEQTKYWASYATSGQTNFDTIITFDTEENAFSLYNGFDSTAPYAANAFARVFTSGQERIYFGDYSGFAYRADNGTNDNPSGTETAVNAYYKTKWFDYGDLVSKKAVPEIVIYYQINSGTVDVGFGYDLEANESFSVKIDTSTSADTYGAGLYDAATYAAEGGAQQRVDVNGRGRLVRFAFSNDRVDESMQIDGIGMFPHLETQA